MEQAQNLNLGCRFTKGFAGDSLSFVRGSAAFHRDCADLVSGRKSSSSCVSIRLVAHSAGRWANGVLQIYLSQHRNKLRVSDLAYGNGEDCFTPEFTCKTDRQLWAERTT